MQYRFTLKDNNRKAYRSFVWFLFFLHVVAAGIIWLNFISSEKKYGVYILPGIYIIATIVYSIVRKKNKAFGIYSFIMALLYACFWFMYVGVIAMVIFISVSLFAYLVKGKKTFVVFSDEGIYVKNVFITILYSWEKLDNVILKDNLLTIDFKSNKIIQAEIAEADEQTDEILFNRFCKEQLQNNN